MKNDDDLRHPLARAIAWLLCSPEFAARASQEALLRGAFTPSERAAYERAERDTDEAVQAFHQRAAAETRRLGERYQMGIAATVAHNVVHADDTPAMGLELSTELRAASSG